MDSKDYYEKLDSIILSDKFVEIMIPSTSSKHPVLKTEKSIQYYLTKYIKPFVSSSDFQNMYPCGSRPGAVYGLAKVHKPDIPLRPVVSMIGTSQYGLAKYLDSIIKPCIPSTYMLSSTKDFVGKLQNMRLPTSHTFVSFDVVSLFTNVPLTETIELACNYVYSSRNPPAFDRKHFKKLLNYATSGEFIYGDKLYKQVDGVAMGSPLGPTLANLFMANLEKEWTLAPNAPTVYFRYVDDIFFVFLIRLNRTISYFSNT